MATFTNDTKNSVSVTNDSKGLAPVSSGQPIGLLLCLTYSGGQTIATGVASFTNVTKN